MLGVLHGVAVAFLLSGLLYVLVGVRARRHHDTPTGIPLTVTMLTQGLTAVVLAGLVLAGASAEQLEELVFAVSLFLPVSWGVFAMTYAGWRRPVTPRVVGLVTVGMLGVSILQLVPMDVEWGTPLGSMFFVVVMVGYLGSGGLAMVGSAAVVRTAYDNPVVDIRSALLLVVGGVAPWMTMLFWGLFESYGLVVAVGELAAGFGLGAVASTVAVEWEEAYESMPAAGNLGRSTMIAELDETVVIADDRGRTVDLNATAQDLFGLDPATAAGEPLEAIVGVDLETLRSNAAIELNTADGNRKFGPSVSTITDGHDRTVGYAILLRDVTEQQTRRQRLEVLNRVLRHNLRNDMNVVEGYAEMAGEHVDDDRSDQYLDQIAATASTLVDLGQKARNVEHLVTAPRVTDERRPVSTVVADVVDDLEGDYPETTFRSVVDVDTEMTLNDALVEQVLYQLAENGAEHNDAVNPRVEIRVAATDDGDFPLAITVADNGPTIPRPEWTVLEDGDETPLEHGSGLGLWIVNWSVTRLGGQVSFTENEPRGNLVTVWLPEQVDGVETVGDLAHTAPGSAGADGPVTPPSDP